MTKIFQSSQFSIIVVVLLSKQKVNWQKINCQQI